jgi:hypothetical protein
MFYSASTMLYPAVANSHRTEFQQTAGGVSRRSNLAGDILRDSIKLSQNLARIHQYFYIVQLTLADVEDIIK